MSHTLHSLLWTPREAGAREMPLPTPICTEKRNYGVFPPRIKIESHIERKERERESETDRDRETHRDTEKHTQRDKDKDLKMLGSLKYPSILALQDSVRDT